MRGTPGKQACKGDSLFLFKYKEMVFVFRKELNCNMNNKDVIEIRCRQCKKLMMNYHVCGDDSAVALQGIGVKCDRCKRVMILKKYTEGILISRLTDGAFRI